MNVSSSNTSNADAKYLYWISMKFVQCYGWLLFSLGFVGHSLNIYVLTRPTLRSNSCTRYFLALTLVGYFIALVNIPLRVLEDGYYIDVFMYSPTHCKVFTFFLQWARALCSWFIVLACVDRSMSTTIHVWSNLRVAPRTIPIVVLIVGLVYIHVPIYHNINLQSQECMPNPGFSQILFAVSNLIFFSWDPSIAVLVFGSLTIRHIRQTVSRIVLQHTQSHFAQNRRKKTDRQLIQMMLIQCLVFSLTASTFSIVWLYGSLRANFLITDALQRAKDNLLGNIVGLVGVTGFCTSFYLFTLSSQLFRREVVRLFSCLRRQRMDNKMIASNKARKN